MEIKRRIEQSYTRTRESTSSLPGSFRWIPLALAATGSLLVACRTSEPPLLVTPTLAAIETKLPISKAAPTVSPSSTPKPNLVPTPTTEVSVSQLSTDRRKLGIKIRQDVIDQINRDITRQYLPGMHIDKYSHKLNQASVDMEGLKQDAVAMEWLNKLDSKDGNVVRGVLTTSNGDAPVDINIQVIYGKEVNQTSQPQKVIYSTKINLSDFAAPEINRDSRKRETVVSLPDAFAALFNVLSKSKWSQSKDSEGEVVGYISQVNDNGYRFTYEIDYLGNVKYTMEKFSTSQASK